LGDSVHAYRDLHGHDKPSGFKSVTIQNVKVDAGVPATVNAKLEVGSVSETVEVTGGAEILQTETARNLWRQVPAASQAALDVPTPRQTVELVALIPRGDLQRKKSAPDRHSKESRSDRSDGFLSICYTIQC
jgi:hypothetical protein